MSKACWLLLVLTAAATAGPATLRVSNISPARHPTVEFSLDAFDGGGAPVPGLAAKDVTIDEGGAPFAPEAVAPHTAPLDLALVVDLSARTASGPLGATLDGLVEKLAATDRAVVVTFSDQPSIAQGLTSDHAKLLSALHKAKPAGGAALRDALIQAAAELQQGRTRKNIVLVTYGRDTSAGGGKPQSGISLKLAAKAAHDQQIPIRVVAVGPALSDALFAKLSAVTGGKVYPAASSAEVAAAAGKLVEDLHHQYRVEFRSHVPRMQGGKRLITVGAGGTATVKVNYMLPPPSTPKVEQQTVEDVPPEQNGPGFDYSPMQ